MMKSFLIKVIDFFRYRKSFSQDGEDIVLESFIQKPKGYKGFFVDIGAHHPIRFSNTWLFYRKGWRGINIDPTPGSMRSFTLLRRGDINLEIGVGIEPSNLSFYCFNEPALNSFDSKLSNERNTGNPYKIIKKINVPVDTLGNILERCNLGSQKIDFFTIDVEGLDLDVLKSNNWDKFTPEFILIEDSQFDIKIPTKSAIYNFLSNKGYKIMSILKRTIIFHK